jgi:purine-binding chemotaxis protein CheW
MNALHVLFQVGDSEFVLPADQVLHMEAFTTATPVPGAPPFVRGLMQVRGRVIPVVDLRARFGLPQEPSPDARVVVVQAGERAVALLADRAREVLRLDTTTFRAAPELVSDGGAGFVSSVADAGGRVLMLLDVPKVIGEETIHGQ